MPNLNKLFNFLVPFVLWLILAVFIIFQQSFIFDKIIIPFYTNQTSELLADFQSEVVSGEENNLSQANLTFVKKDRDNLLADFSKKTAVFLSHHNNFMVKILDMNKNLIYSSASNDVSSFDSFLNDKNGFAGFLEKLISPFNHYNESAPNNEVFTVDKLIYNNTGDKIDIGYFLEVGSPLWKITSSGKDELGLIYIYYNISDSTAAITSLRDLAIFAISCLVLLSLVDTYFWNKKINNIFAIFQDNITKLKEESIESEQKNQFKTIIMGNLCEEMDISIKNIYENSENIKNEVFGTIKIKSYTMLASAINESANHLLFLTKDTMDYAKASSDQLTINYSIFDIRKIVTACAQIIETQTNQAGIKIQLKNADSKMLINADQARVKQAILNILSNSIKYTAMHGVISISTMLDKSKKYETIVIEIEDNGIGIAEQVLAQSNENFKNIQKINSTKFDGTGLGIPFTRYIIENMRGRFEISSRAGKGTKVRFSFNRIDESML